MAKAEKRQQMTDVPGSITLEKTMRNYANEKMTAFFNDWGLSDRLLKTLLTVSAHEYFNRKRGVTLSETDLFEFACHVLWHLGLVKYIGKKRRAWVHRPRLERLMLENGRLSMGDLRDLDWSRGVSADELWKKMLDRLNLELDASAKVRRRAK